MHLHESPNIPLGKISPYPQAYDPSLLIPISRSSQRQAMGFTNLSLHGFDLWHFYELFWLNHNGKAVRAQAELSIPADSSFLLESKSVKLYLHSLNHQRFINADEFVNIIYKDITRIVQCEINIVLHDLHRENNGDYISLNHLDVEVDYYHRNPLLLIHKNNAKTKEKLMTTLFKSHCLYTHQPDFANIYIEYEGQKIDEASLLLYLLSFRDHQAFSENIIEQIFIDITNYLSPQYLKVKGEFISRGGIAINPCRMSVKG